MPAKSWSLTILREELVKVGTWIVCHGCYVTFQLAEFAAILRWIECLRGPPVAAA